MDPVLLKYATRDVPRYTSYPSAAQFEDFSENRVWRGWLADLRPDADLSVYVHIPFCEKLCWYCGCHTSVPNGYQRASDYVDTLLREIDQTSPLVGTDHGKVSHLHFGGGTPTFLHGDDIGRIVSRIDEQFGLAENGEVAIEIDPRTFSRAQGAALAGMGFNRASFGVQDFNLAVQQKINRVQPYELVEQCVNDLRETGIAAVNFDLIYGLPVQTTASVIETAKQAAGLAPSRLSVFGYAHLPWFKKHMTLIKDEDLPDAAARYDQALAISQTLVHEGYVAVGLDHFVRPDDPMAKAVQNGTLRRNFQGYTTDMAEAMIGFGVSSISAFPGGYAQGGRDTLTWRTAVETGQSPVKRGLILTKEDRMRAEIIERLMCDFRVNAHTIAAQHGFAKSVLAPSYVKLAALEQDGMVQLDGSEIIVPDERRIFVRAVAQAFDAYYAPQPKRHARAV